MIYTIVAIRIKRITDIFFDLARKIHHLVDIFESIYLMSMFYVNNFQIYFNPNLGYCLNLFCRDVACYVSTNRC